MQENPLVNFAKFSNQFPYCVYSISNKFKTRNLLFKFIHVVATIITQRSHLAFRYIPLCPVSSNEISKLRSSEFLQKKRDQETNPLPSLYFLHVWSLRDRASASNLLFISHLCRRNLFAIQWSWIRGEGENGFDAFANKLLLNSAGRY